METGLARARKPDGPNPKVLFPARGSPKFLASPRASYRDGNYMYLKDKIMIFLKNFMKIQACVHGKGLVTLMTS